MTADSPLDRLTVVCVGVQGSANLGSVARAMTNFGLGRLVLVAPACGVDPEARRMACHAGHILDGLETVDTLDAVLPRFTLLAGTSGKTRLSSCAPPLEPEEAASEILAAARTGPVGLLFGPEDHGLSNKELTLCRWVIRIPASHRNPSLNLSHAAAIVFSHLYRRCGLEARIPARKGRGAAGVDTMEKLYAHLREVLLDVGFLHANNPERILYVLRRVLGRSSLDEREATILHGILSQVDWALKESGRSFRR